MTDLEIVLKALDILGFTYCCEKFADGSWYVETACMCGDANFNEDGSVKD